MAVVDDVREALEQTVPDFSDRSGDWAGVLTMAQTGEGDRRGRAGASQSRRRRNLIALAVAVLGVVVVTASAFGTVRELFGNGKPHVARGFYPSEGKRGSFTVRLVHMSDGAGNATSEWRILPEPTQNTPSPTGQYVHVSGRGRILRIGGHAEAWHAGFVGFVSRPGEAKQRVVITMKGRPKGVFVLTPLQPGFLKRDSGTREYHWATG
jgi:hypothetical protein